MPRTWFVLAGARPAGAPGSQGSHVSVHRGVECNLPHVTRRLLAAALRRVEIPSCVPAQPHACWSDWRCTRRHCVASGSHGRRRRRQRTCSCACSRNDHLCVLTQRCKPPSCCRHQDGSRLPAPIQRNRKAACPEAGAAAGGLGAAAPASMISAGKGAQQVVVWCDACCCVETLCPGLHAAMDSHQEKHAHREDAALQGASGRAPCQWSFPAGPPLRRSRCAAAWVGCR
jgi:hypothetical protein